MNLNQLHEAYLKDPLLVDEFAAKLTSFVTSIVKTECLRRTKSTFNTIEDAIGDSLVEVWEGLGAFNPEKSQFTTWVTTITLRNIVDIFRKYKKRQELSYDPSMDKPTTMGPHNELDMSKLTSQLSTEDKFFIQYKLQGLSEVELAAAFGKNPKWAKNKWYRLAEKLRLLAAAVE